MLYFVFGRVKRKHPKLRTPEAAPHVEQESVQESTEDLAQKSIEAPTPPAVIKMAPVQESSAQPKAVKNPRGVFFAFNGHEWEAYEVLGCQVGEGLEVATKVYQNHLRTSDPSTFDFYEAAYNAILKSNRS